MTTRASDHARPSVADLRALIDEHFPQVHEGNGRVEIEFLGPMTARVRMARDERSMRPGGTMSGPAMFKLADFAVYVAILAELGTGAMEAVTTSMTINFLLRPPAADRSPRLRLIGKSAC